MGDQVEQGGTSTSGCSGDGVPEKSFVVEPRSIAVVQLEDAMFTHRIGDGGRFWLGLFAGVAVELAVGSGPSWVGMEAGQALVHQGFRQGLFTLPAAGPGRVAAPGL